ncbi:hypothetical protein R6Z07F_003933 [Ovis aries]
MASWPLPPEGPKEEPTWTPQPLRWTAFGGLTSQPSSGRFFTTSRLGSPSYKEEMCLGWRPTFRSSTSFLPKEPSLELPTVFTRKLSNNTLDLGAWPDHRRGLPHPENYPSGSLAHDMKRQRLKLKKAGKTARPFSKSRLHATDTSWGFLWSSERQPLIYNEDSADTPCQVLRFIDFRISSRNPPQESIDILIRKASLKKVKYLAKITMLMCSRARQRMRSEDLSSDALQYFPN